MFLFKNVHAEKCFKAVLNNENSKLCEKTCDKRIIPKISVFIKKTKYQTFSNRNKSETK